MSSGYSEHYSVMLKDCLEHLKNLTPSDKKKVFVDLTFGAGGHTLALAEAFPEAFIISTDQDPEAFANGQKIIREKKLENRIMLLNMNFSTFPDWFEKSDYSHIDGVIMDLGVSSHHFDSFERGFSFREDAPLDMRMNPADDSIETAADILNTYPEEEIANIIFKYGEERLSRKIAKKIVEERKNGGIQTTKQLENIVFHCYPASQRHKKTHPATRTFQAIRIFVNKELEVLENTIPKLYELMGNESVMLIISFHSLEDRIVKHKFKEIFQIDKNAAKIITKRPQLPSEEEISENPRSRSAKLRVLCKN